MAISRIGIQSEKNLRLVGHRARFSAITDSRFSDYIPQRKRRYLQTDLFFYTNRLVVVHIRFEGRSSGFSTHSVVQVCMFLIAVAVSTFSYNAPRSFVLFCVAISKIMPKYFRHCIFT